MAGLEAAAPSWWDAQLLISVSDVERDLAAGPNCIFRMYNHTLTLCVFPNGKKVFFALTGDNQNLLGHGTDFLCICPVMRLN